MEKAADLRPLKHSFNPLKDLDYKRAREIADMLYTVSPQGENTLTVRNGKRALLKVLLELPPALRRHVLLMDEKIASGTAHKFCGANGSCQCREALP